MWAAEQGWKGIWLWSWTLIFRVEWSKEQMPGWLRNFSGPRNQKHRHHHELPFTEWLRLVHEFTLLIFITTLWGWYYYYSPPSDNKERYSSAESLNTKCDNPQVAESCHQSHTEDCDSCHQPRVWAGYPFTFPIPSLSRLHLACTTGSSELPRSSKVMLCSTYLEV